MKKFLVAAILIFAGFAANAQPYDWSIGVRGGYGLGSLNARHYLGSSNAIDLSGSFSFNGWGWEVSGIYEWTMPVIDEGFEFYYGLGAQAGGFNADDISYFAAGAVGVVGLEYAVPSIPLCVFLDYRPRLTCTFGQGLGFGYNDVGLGLRIYF